MNITLKTILAFGTVASLSALAAPQLSPQGIIVNPINTQLSVQTWLDRDVNGTGNSDYNIGDKIKISTNVNESAYVYLFDIDTNGNVSMIFPNSLNPNNFVGAGETKTFPQPGANFDFTVSGPTGIDQVLVVASRTPLSVNQIADIRTGQGRVQGADALARALSIVVSPINQNDWVSDAVSFRVQNSYAVQPNTIVVTPVQPNPVFVDVQPIPGWFVINQNGSRNDKTFTYRGGDFNQAYVYYHNDLVKKGWTRTSFKQNRGHGKKGYYAVYIKGNERTVVQISPVRGTVEINFTWTFGK